jgi:hypothetical protein
VTLATIVNLKVEKEKEKQKRDDDVLKGAPISHTILPAADDSVPKSCCPRKDPTRVFIFFFLPFSFSSTRPPRVHKNRVERAGLER